MDADKQAEAVRLLDELAQLQALRKEVELARQAAIDAVLTAEIKAQLAAVEAEYAPELSRAGEIITEREAQAKAAVLALGDSVKGEHLQAVYNVGRARWDDRKLLRYAQNHPEVLQLREQGDAYVALRWLGK